MAPARRLLFTFIESDNLSTLRRKIGLHEQILTLWYSSLIYGSLWRLENGQEEVRRQMSDSSKELVKAYAKLYKVLVKQEKLAARIKIITALENFQESELSRRHHRRKDLANLDEDSFRAVLRKAGIPEEQIMANLKFTKSYIRASKEGRQKGSSFNGSHSRPEWTSSLRSSPRSSRKQMENEIKQKEKECKKKETQVSTQISEKAAAIDKPKSSLEGSDGPSPPKGDFISRDSSQR